MSTTPPPIMSSTTTTTTTPPSLRFSVLVNDGTNESFISLISLKEILSRQLPKMPREYITRYLFDKNHVNIGCFFGTDLVGGVCFRPFPQQRLAEIAFLAVSSIHQVQKIGSKLMAHLKEYARQHGLTHFLTFADNYALGYFKKQGFSSTITLPKERWQGYVKEYDGGTLMECFVHPQINMLEIYDLVKRQRLRLMEQVVEVRTNNPEPQHVWSRSSGGTSLSVAFQQVPGIKEAGWSPPLDVSSKTPSSSSGGGGAALAEMQTAFRSVLDRIVAHRDSWPFLEPVPESVVDYFTIITEPIDLSLIRKRIHENQYASDPAKMRRDLNLMISNCKTYNAPVTNYWKAAVGLEKFMDTLFEDGGQQQQ